MIWLVVLLVLVVIAGIIWRRFSMGDTPADDPVIPNGPYHAVSIKLQRATACDAAKSLNGKRFLSKEAPQIPLPECNAPVCLCSYRHHEDRRRGPRRAKEIGLPKQHFHGEDRRSKHRGRRASDWPGEEQEAVDLSETYYDYLDTQAMAKLDLEQGGDDSN